MASPHQTFDSLQAAESDHYQQLIADERFKSNPLLPKLQQLHEHYRSLAQKTERLLKEKAQLETQLSNMNRSLNLATRIDPMTGLANRRAMMELLEQEFSRASRHQRAISIVIADLDTFKRVNDAHGFNTGDDVLVEVARVLRGCVRNEDFCGRWGGEEFMFLLPETELEGALAVANKIRESVAMTEFVINKPGVRLTISLGVCSHQNGQNIFDAVTGADQALHKAKMGGGNRTVAVS